jgi:hypothetical protein
MRFALAPFVIVLVALALDIRSAQACSCMSEPSVETFPLDDATDVPTDAVIIVPADDYFLEESDGTPIAFEERHFRQPPFFDYIILIPTGGLAPNTRVSVHEFGSTDEDGLLSFLTGSGATQALPDVPVVGRTLAYAHPAEPPWEQCCGSPKVIEPTIENRGEALVAFDFADIDGGDIEDTNVRELDLPLAWSESNGKLADFITSASRPQVSNGLGGALPSTTPTVRFRVSFVDVAGNFGPWSAWQEVTVPPNVPVLPLMCACAGVRASVMTHVAFALGAVVLILGCCRRRNRPRGP